MEDLLVTVEAFIREHQMWAGIIVGVIAFGESLVLVGMVIPATALMLLIGGLVGGGIIGPVPVLVGCVLGAIIGDVVSYIIGRWMGPSVVHKRPLNRYKSGIARTRLFFRKYGFAAVFFGRFLGPIRSLVPLVAGMMAMDQRRFQLANVGSAIVWAPIMLAPGWMTAKGASTFGEMTEAHWLGLFIIVAVGAVVGSAIIAWWIKRSTPPRRRAMTAR